ncbi:MAG: uroporphyrinogen-III synthase [Thermoplasmataceae archaeon]
MRLDNKKLVLSTRPIEKWVDDTNNDLFEVINVPLSTLSQVEIGDEDLRMVKEFAPNIIILTSSYGVKVFIEKLWNKIPFEKVQFLSIGNYTAKALRTIGIESIVPDSKTSDGIINFLKINVNPNSRILLLRSNMGNKSVDNFLRSRNLRYFELKLYDICEDKSGIEAIVPLIQCSNLIGVIITSSFEATVFLDTLRREKIELRENVVIFVIGSTTYDTFRKLGYEGKIITGYSDFDALIVQIKKMLHSGEWI